MTVVGHLSDDATTKFTSDDKMMVFIRLWTKEYNFHTKESEFVNYKATLFGKPAEWMQSAKKGQLVCVSGSILPDLWIPDNGEPRVTLAFTRCEATLLERSEQADTKSQDEGAKATVPAAVEDDSEAPF